MVLHQVPQLGTCLLVGRDHGCPRAEAIGAAGCTEQALWGRGWVCLLGWGAGPHGPLPRLSLLCPRSPAGRGGPLCPCWPSALLSSKELEASQGQDTVRPPELSWQLRLATGPAKVTTLRTPTVATEGTSKGEGVGHVIGRHLFGHQCHQGTICYLETPETGGSA